MVPPENQPAGERLVPSRTARTNGPGRVGEPHVKTERWVFTANAVLIRGPKTLRARDAGSTGSSRRVLTLRSPRSGRLEGRRMAAREESGDGFPEVSAKLVRCFFQNTPSRRGSG